MGRAFHFPLQMRGKKTSVVCSRLLRPAPPPPVQRAAQRGPPGQPSLPPEAPVPPRGRRGARGARSIRARWARYIVWLYVCLWAGPSKQAYTPPYRRPSTLAGVFLARGKVAAEDFVSGRASPTCPWRPP